MVGVQGGMPARDRLDLGGSGKNDFKNGPSCEKPTEGTMYVNVDRISKNKDGIQSMDRRSKKDGG